MDPQPRPFKYSAHVEKSDVNTSHAIVMDLVGTAKRVLDVGCASGYLAEALVAAGNKVSGVEIDPGAAEIARPHLDRLVVGDVEQLDLVEELGAAEFDVVVFADVLEHLKDPTEVLRRSRPLLAEGGYAVISIPNVAHGSVRLALLRGHFDYSPVGLLDETHLRFFTRPSFDQLIVDAGFVPTETRYTTAGSFDTEMALDRSDYPAGVVAEVEADPESRIYQFVARAEPADTGEGTAAVALAERNRELHEARRTLAEIARLAAGGPGHPVLGLIDPAIEEIGALVSLRLAVSHLELRRRLAGFEVRALACAAEPSASGLGDEVCEPLLPWSEARAGDLRGELDGVAVLPGPAARPAGRVVDDLAGAGMPLHRAQGDAVDPLVLAGRLLSPAAARERLGYLRVTGLAPEGPFALVVGAAWPAAGPGVPEVEAVTAPPSVAALDLMGLVAAARFVVTASPALAALAVGLDRPVVGVLDGSGPAPFDALAGRIRVVAADSVAAAIGALAERDGGRGGGGRGRKETGGGKEVGGGPAGGDAALASRADAYFDQVWAAAIGFAGQKVAASVPERLAELRRRIATLEAVNAGLRRALAKERQARPPAASEAEGGAVGLQVELHRASSDRARLEAEIERIYATRIMRAAAPARRLYARLRNLVS